MKALGLIEWDGKRYACRLTGKGTKVALTFVLFYHQPNSGARPNSKLEAAHHNAGASIRNLIQLYSRALRPGHHAMRKYRKIGHSTQAYVPLLMRGCMLEAA